MNDAQLFEIAAKLQNVRPDQLRLKRRYLDVVVIEKMDGAKYTYFVADLEAMVVDGQAVAASTADGGPPTVEEPRPAKPQNTRKR